MKPVDGDQTALRDTSAVSRWGPRGEKVAAILARQIVRDIAVEQIDAGTGLESEATMLDRYGVSRASLREALRILETMGLIQIKPGPGGGPIVAAVDAREFGRMATMYFQVQGVRFREVVDARLIIEPLMAELAAQTDDADGKTKLGQIAAAGWHALDQTEWMRASDDFHSQVVSISGNGLLGLLARSLKSIYMERVAGLAFPEEERDNVRTVHDAIARAVIRGDAKRARRLMADHMREYSENVAKRHPSLMEEIVDWR